MDGKSRVKDCLQQSKNKSIFWEKKYFTHVQLKHTRVIKACNKGSLWSSGDYNGLVTMRPAVQILLEEVRECLNLIVRKRLLLMQKAMGSVCESIILICSLMSSI